MSIPLLSTCLACAVGRGRRPGERLGGGLRAVLYSPAEELPAGTPLKLRFTVVASVPSFAEFVAVDPAGLNGTLAWGLTDADADAEPCPNFVCDMSRCRRDVWALHWCLEATFYFGVQFN